MEELLKKYGISEGEDIEQVYQKLKVQQMNLSTMVDVAEDDQSYQEIRQSLKEIEFLLQMLEQKQIDMENLQEFGEENTIETDEEEDYISLGFAYEHGLGTEEDWVKAAEMYRLAAEQGETEGLNRLADMYEWGRGVEKDIDKARQLYREAISKGDEQAAKGLELLEKRIIRKQEDVAYNRYFAATALLMAGKQEEAIKELKTLAGEGNSMAQEKLLELGGSGQNSQPTSKDMITDRVVSDVTEIQQYRGVVNTAFKKMFSKGQSAKLKELENSIKIQHIENNPVLYITADAYYEHRELYTTRKPSSLIRAASERRKEVTDYNLWQLAECVAPKELFEEQHNEMVLSDSLYLEQCPRCRTCGTVHCTNCDNGNETCPQCNGYGRLRCGCCGGSGEVKCSHCGGRGYNRWSGIIGYDSENRAIYGDREEACSYCGTRGTETCGNCGGSGSVTCGCCNGMGSITCRVCGGTTRVTCPDCAGNGYFLNTVNVKQDFGTVVYYDVPVDYQVKQQIYGRKQFDKLCPNDKDRLLSSVVDTGHIDRTEAIREFGGVSYNLAELMAAAENKCRTDRNARILNYRSRVCMRDVLDISYQFDRKDYHMMLDAATGQTLVDTNPYEHVADSMIDEMEADVKEGRYKRFLFSYKEFEAITASDDVAHSIRDLASLLGKAEKKLMKAAGITAFAVYLLCLIFQWIKRGRLFWGLPGVAALVLAVGSSLLLAKKFWKRIVFEQPGLTEIAIGILSGIISLVLAYLRFKFF